VHHVLVERDLPRTLGLRDLVLVQILVVVGLNWLGPAARLGTRHWIYWLFGIVLFHLPLALVVMHLSRRMPLEGGPYQWAKAAFGPRTGFLVAWNIWLFALLFTSTLGITVTTAIGYATGATESWFSSRPAQIALSIVITAVLVLLAIAGFATSKWFHNTAAAALLITSALLVALPYLAGRATPLPQPTGSLSFMQVVLFTRIAVFALAGFECMAFVIGECRGGARTLSQSIALAVPCIATIYILGTRSVLAFVPAADVDLVYPAAQTFAIALRPFALTTAAGAVILLLVARDLAQASQVFSAITRLPLVAGWDELLPPWFTRLHPTRKTPVNSILVAGAILVACAIAAIFAAGRQEAFQLLLGTAGVFFASTYLVLFTIPLIAADTPWWLRLAAASGLIVTAAFVVLSFIPIVEVQSPGRYAAVIAFAVIAANAVGLVLLRAARTRK
jgi:amino acid transporter